MAVKIRLQRHGATHAPVYRMVAADSRAPRDGRYVELLGSYAPQAPREEDTLNLELERIDYWLGVGAQPSDTARTLINRARRELKDGPKPEKKADEPKADEPKAEEQAEEPKAEAPAAEEAKAEEPAEAAAAEKPAES